MSNNPGQELQSLRRKEIKTCPICGGTREAVIRAADICPKCKDRLRKRELTKAKNNKED
jgi:hypothetical protein